MKKLFKKISEKIFDSPEKIKERGIINDAVTGACMGAVFGYFVSSETVSRGEPTTEDRLIGALAVAIFGAIVGAIYSVSKKNKYSKKVIDWIRKYF